jgi:hypothetical protein
VGVAIFIMVVAAVVLGCVIWLWGYIHPSAKSAVRSNYRRQAREEREGQKYLEAEEQFLAERAAKEASRKAEK